MVPVTKSLGAHEVLLLFCCHAEGGEAGVAPGCTERKPSTGERSRIEVVDEELVVDKVADATVGSALDADNVPMIRTQEVGAVGVLHEYGRTMGWVVDGERVSRVPTETGCSVMVAAVAQVVAFQAVTLGEAAAALRQSRKRLTRHPEAVEVGEPVARATIDDDAGSVLDGTWSRQGLIPPERKALGRSDVERITSLQDACLRRLSFDAPVGSGGERSEK